MKWPWVSRAQAEADLHYARWERDTLAACREQEAASFQREREMMADRFDALLEKFTALRVQGAMPEPKPIVLTPEQVQRMTLQDHGDDLRDLIESRSAGNLRVRGMMLRQLERDRADKLDDDVIRRNIERGVESSGVPT